MKLRHKGWGIPCDVFLFRRLYVVHLTHISVSFLFQGKPVEILPFLYLGSAYHASRQDYLSDLHITALLNVSRRDLQPAKGHYDYKWIPVEDSHMADISSHFQEAIEFIGGLKEENTAIFPF